MRATQAFQPRTKVGKFLLWFWDLIDISENLHRTDKWVRKVDSGLNSLLHAISMFVLTLVGLAFAWYWDLQSTIVGMSTITELVVPSLPLQVARMTQIIIVGLSLAPTLMELFTAGMAKEDIRIVQATIIGLAFFDLITDIPRAYAFSAQLWPQLALLDWYVSYPSFWAFFFFWLFMSTFGFEVLSIVFGFAFIAFLWKFIDQDGSKSDAIAERLNRVMQTRHGEKGKVTIEQ